MRAVLALAIIVCGLAGRAALDKVLALRGGAELVALWAQLASVMDLVAGAALSGVGTGIAVLVARQSSPAEQRATLREAVRMGLAVSSGVMAATGAVCLMFPDTLLGARTPLLLLALSAAIGWLGVIPGVVNGYWTGLRARGRMLALAAAAAIAPLAAALLAPAQGTLPAVLLAHAVPVALVAAVVPWAPSGEPAHRQALRRYVLPGLSIGILSPGSMLVVRAIVSSQLSWHDAGLLQALWRATDWVASLAGGVMSLVFLPRLSVAAGTPQFRHVMRRAASTTMLPSAAALGLLWIYQRPVLAWLYDERFALPDLAALLLLAGSAVRVLAWLALFGLYARRSTIAIAAGELLSLPLFALLLALLASSPRALTLESVAAAWLLSFVAYAAFNLLALRASAES
ncbi:MAG: hypothetical protein ACJ8G4_11530 [Burkholderiales bacterium]